MTRSAQLGGRVAGYGLMFPQGRKGCDLVATLEKRCARPGVTVFTNAELMAKSGSFGTSR